MRIKDGRKVGGKLDEGAGSKNKGWRKEGRRKARPREDEVWI